MFNILEQVSEYNNSWNYTFLIVAIIAIIIGTILTLIKIKKNKSLELNLEEKESLDEKVFDNPENLIKKK